MASFFEKLKKGMGIEMTEEKPEKMEEKLKEELKAPPKKKAVKKIKIETGFSESKLKKAEKEEPQGPEKKLEVLELEEKILEEKTEMKPEAKKIFPPKIEKEEEKSESNRQGFALQNLASQEGQLAVDVYQTDSELVIQSTIAGVKPEELDISIEADTVLIKGNRNEPPEPEEKNYFYQECYWGPFSRQIIMPEETDPSRATAEMKEGVLTIRIPKIERKKKRKIAVRA